MTEASSTERNQRRLRDAMDRLLSGRAEASDGKLTLKSLATEAGVPRPYLYRPEYLAIARDFEHRVQLAKERGETPDGRIAELEALQSELATQRRLAKERGDQVNAGRVDIRKAANQILFLTEQNRALRDELNAARAVSTIGSASEPASSLPKTPYRETRRVAPGE